MIRQWFSTPACLQWPWFTQIFLVGTVTLISTFSLQCFMSTSTVLCWVTALYATSVVGTSFYTVSLLGRKIISQNQPYRWEWFLQWANYFHETWRKLFNQPADDFVPHRESVEEDECTVKEEIRLLTDNIVRDYVRSWYALVGSSSEVPEQIGIMLDHFFTNLVRKVMRINRHIVTRRMIQAFHAHYQEYIRALRRSVRRRRSSTAVLDAPDPASLFRLSHSIVKDANDLHNYLLQTCRLVLQTHGPSELLQSSAGEMVAAMITDKILMPTLSTVINPSNIKQKILCACNDVKNTSQSSSATNNKEITLPEPDNTPSQKSFTLRCPMRSVSLREPRKRPVVPARRAETSKELVPKDVATTNRSASYNNLAVAVPVSSGSSEIGSALCAALGKFIPATAGPLLPDNTSVTYKPTHKMWNSPTSEEAAKHFPCEDISVQDGSDAVVGITVNEQSSVPASPDVQDALETSLFLTVEHDSSNSSIQTLTRDGKRPTLTRSASVSFDEDDGNVNTDSRRNSRPSSLPDERDRVDDDDIGGDSSPVYEEAGDFATTIAKLRALLEQRNSQQSLLSQSSQGSKSSPRSTECESNNSSQGQFSFSPGDSVVDSSRQESLESDKAARPGDLLPVDLDVSESIEAMEASEVPIDGRLFINISIPDTEVHTEDSGSQYTLYCIHYEGIYMGESSSEGSSDGLVLHAMRVHRRFREFLALQSRLEENPRYRAALRGIKAPTKWLQLPFTKMDQTTVANRRNFLEAYLQQLCSQPVLADSEELREFLAYGLNNPSAAHSYKAPEIVVPRIDRLLAKTVSGVFNTLKTALPSFEALSPSWESPPIDHSSHSFPTTPLGIPVSRKAEGNILQQIFHTGTNLVQKPDSLAASDMRISFENDTQGENLEEVISKQLGPLQSVKLALIDHGKKDVGDSIWDSTRKGSFGPLLTILHNQRKESSESAFEDEQDQMDAQLPLSSSLFNFVFDLFPHPGSWQPQESVITVTKVLFGNLFETWLQGLVESSLSDVAVSQCLRHLRLTYFPTEVLKNQESYGACEVTAKDVTEAVLHKIPRSAQWFVGPQYLMEGIELVIELFSHQTLNIDLMLTFLEVILVDMLSSPDDH